MLLIFMRNRSDKSTDYGKKSAFTLFFSFLCTGFDINDNKHKVARKVLSNYYVDLAGTWLNI